MTINEAGLNLIKKAESFSPTWYLCPAGVQTIGFGTTEGAVYGVNRGTVRSCTQEQAEDWLLYSIDTTYAAEIKRRVRVPLTQNQFSALVSFVYNVGPHAFSQSTLLRRLNQKDYDGAAGEFRKWVMGGGKILRGLVKRRAAERELFLSQDPRPVDPVERHRVAPYLSNVKKVKPLPPEKL